MSQASASLCKPMGSNKSHVCTSVCWSMTPFTPNRANNVPCPTPDQHTNKPTTSLDIDTQAQDLLEAGAVFMKNRSNNRCQPEDSSTTLSRSLNSYNHRKDTAKSHLYGFELNWKKGLQICFGMYECRTGGMSCVRGYSTYVTSDFTHIPYSSILHTFVSPV